MILPNLLIVGAAKSGTTSLHNYLNQHPDIFMSQHKEPHFLINDEIGFGRIPKGINKIEDYSNLFIDSENYKYRGESSAMYLQFPDITIKNIKRYLEKEVKIIIMLRNPIDRAFSAYHHVKRYNVDENLTFDEAIQKCEERYFENKKITPASRYIHIGMYHDFVKKFMTDFANQLHIIIYDDFISNTDQELSKVLAFLGLNEYNIDVKKQYMVGGWKWKNHFLRRIFMKGHFIKKLIKIIIPFNGLHKYIRKIFKSSFTVTVENMNNETRERLKEIYKDDVKKLSKFLNKDLNFWIT